MDTAESAVEVVLLLHVNSYRTCHSSGLTAWEQARDLSASVVTACKQARYLSEMMELLPVNSSGDLSNCIELLHGNSTINACWCDNCM